MKRTLTFIAGLLLAGSSYAGDVVAPKKALTLDGARKIIAAGVAEAHRRNNTGVIAVVDDGGNLVAVERIDGTFPAGSLISYGKARTAAIFKKPTRDFEKIIRDGRTPMVALNDFTPLQGGVPIEVDGQVVGAVGVSGASSAQADDEIAVAAARGVMSADAVSARDSSGGAGAATAFSKDEVDAAFAKGAVLFENPSVNYAIHASRRTQPGQAEVHTLETDVIRVVSGTATFVTGGTVVDSRETAPNEIRGREIARGETRTLSAGDVVIVPRGVPHWFKQVPANEPLLYYVIKVRDGAPAASLANAK
jgi:glc operon protein GlcG